MAIVPRNLINSFIVVFLLSAAERPDGERFRSPAGLTDPVVDGYYGRYFDKGEFDTVEAI
jgi:hypothetical protein